MQKESVPDNPLKIDVVIPTYNRAERLEKTITSLLQAKCPECVELNIYAVDNNSKDNTAEIVRSFGGNVHYIFEATQGRSHALNAGISSGAGEIIGFIDDDEEVRHDWLTVIAEWMIKQDVDFIGGPYLSYPDFSMPSWFPVSYCGVIGITPAGESPQLFADDGGPMLLGGNTVIRRSTLLAAGGYNGLLGRTDKNLLSCEDEDLFFRLINARAKGFYVPDLAIFHFVPQHRLSKSYCRKWCFWRGVSQATLAAMRPCTMPSVFGVPRFMFGRCLREISQLLTIWNARKAFQAELRWWDAAGWSYGSYLQRRSAARAAAPREAEATH